MAAFGRGGASKPPGAPADVGDAAGEPREKDYYATALDLLARREHAPVELARKLTARGADAATIESTLERLQQAGFLSEQRFADEWVRRHGVRRGLERLKHDLAARSVSPECIASALQGLAVEQLPLAEAARAKRFGDLPRNMTERARQWRFLLGRGFSADVVRRVLGGED